MRFYSLVMFDFDITELLPHRPPMLLVKGILDVQLEKEFILASAECSEKDLLYDAELGGVSPAAAIEIQAQAIGLFCGYSDKVTGNKPASIGKLLSVKQYKVYTTALPINVPLQVEAKSVLNAPPVGVFACCIRAGEQLLSEAEITVYRED